MEEMYDWMVNIGVDGRGATPKSALRIRKEILKLATGEGITHRQWSSKGIKNFFGGIKVDLSYDVDEILRKSHRFEDRYGKDPSHGWLFRGPLQKLKAYKEYVEKDTPILLAKGGKFVVRGGRSEIMEGETFQRHVVIEFPSYDEAMAAYNDPEYQEVAKIRQRAADSVIIVVEGAE